MRLILIGCEYAGKTTLAVEISRWMIRTMGLPFVRWHNHFIIPQVDRHLVVHAEDCEDSDRVPGKKEEDLLTPEDETVLMQLSPGLKEQFQRHMIWRHLHQSAYREEVDYLLLNWYYADSVYAEMYYGYGAPGTFSDRHLRARAWDTEIMSMAPDTVLVLVHAEPDVIRSRMRAAPRPRLILREQDIATVTARFHQAYEDSLIERRFVVNTSVGSPEDSLHSFLSQMWPYLSQKDLLRYKRYRSGDSSLECRLI